MMMVVKMMTFVPVSVQLTKVTLVHQVPVRLYIRHVTCDMFVHFSARL